MSCLTIFSILMLFGAISLISITPAFADHSEVTIVPADGSGAPGCEETPDGCYIPSTATVDVGGVVIMSNTDTAAHTYTSGNPADGPDGIFDTSLLMAGSSFEWSPDMVGEYPYFCMVHPWMVGTIIVQEVGTAEEETPEEETMMEDEPVQTIAVGNTALWVEISGDKIYVSNPADGTIHIIDANTNQVVDTIQSMVGVTVLEVVEEKNKLYASVMEHAPIQVYDLTTGESLGQIDIGEAIITQWSKADTNYGQREYIHIHTNAIGLDYEPSTELLYAVHSTVNHVNYIDTNTDTNLGDIPVGKTPLLITIDETRNIGYVTNVETNNVSVIDLVSNEEINTLATGFVPDQMEIDYDTDQLYVTHHASPHVAVIDLKTHEIKTKIQLDGPTHAIALDKNKGLIHLHIFLKVDLLVLVLRVRWSSLILLQTKLLVILNYQITHLS